MGDNRVVVLVDMDCFYCQVEVRLNPVHQGKPLAVVQYNAWRGGGIIAVNYEARDKGVKRGMRGDEAKKLCPGIVLCQVAEVRGKADLTKYRDAGREIVDVLQEFTSSIQVASIDESYMDITESVEDRLLQISESENGMCLEKLASTFVIGFSDDKSNDEDQRVAGLKNWLQHLSEPSYLRLAVGAMIVEEMRAAVYKRTSFRCSAGISYNKPLAKLVCAVHKPNRQTVLPPDKVELFFSSLPLRKMRNLGGKFGTEVVERLGCQTMGDLARFSLQELQQNYDEKNGLWLYNIAHGIDHEPVTKRLIAKSIGCSKNFPGRTALALRQKVEHWIRELTTELVVRLTEDQVSNKRRAQHLTVSVSQDTEDRSLGTVARSGTLPCYSVDRIVALALQLISKTNTAPTSSLSWDPPIKNISLSAGKFTADCSSQKTSIQSFFKQVPKADNSHSKNESSSENDSQSRIFFQAKRRSAAESSKGLESGLPEKRLKRSSLDNFFKQSNVSSDNDSSRDMFMDDVSLESNSSENADKSTTGKSSSSDMESTSKFNNTVIGTQSGKRKELCPSTGSIKNAVCPENLESAAPHSFFARYILSNKMGKPNGRNCNVECEPSTSTENYRGSPDHATRDLDSNSSSSSSSASEKTNGNGGEICEKCEECGKPIPLQEFPEHVDYHSALRLQKELNETLTPPDNIAPGPSTSKQTSSSNDSSSKETAAGSNAGPPVEKCSYCSKLIPLEQFPEHIDYHSALDLQRELNRAPAPVINSNPSSIIGKKSNNKKGRSAKPGPSPNKKMQSNSITSFFGPK